MPATIVQTLKLPATPNRIYSVLMDSRKHAAFTASSAKISRAVGGSFSIYDDYISGYNLDLVPNKRIVQAWRADDWPAGAYSIVTFLLEAAGTGHTVLKFSQTGVPDKHRRELIRGWKDFYWRPLKDYLS